MLPAHAHGQIGVRVLQQAVLADLEVHEADRGDVQEGQDPRLRPRHDVLAKSRQGGRAGAARIDQRGDPRASTGLVGLDAQVVAGKERVGMHVHESRDDVTSGDVDHRPARVTGNRRGDGRDAPGGEGHVARAVHSGRGVDNVTPLEEQLVVHRARILHQGWCAATADGGGRRSPPADIPGSTTAFVPGHRALPGPGTRGPQPHEHLRPATLHLPVAFEARARARETPATLPPAPTRADLVRRALSRRVASRQGRAYSSCCAIRRASRASRPAIQRGWSQMRPRNSRIV